MHLWQVIFDPEREVIVDDRVFVLGLDYLYREAMKTFEAERLLPCIEQLAQALSVIPEEIPIEGYYTESRALGQYFKTMRALQEVPRAREPQVKGLEAFETLLKILTSGLFGQPVYQGKLLPVGRDPLSKALWKHAGQNWSIPILLESAYQFADGIDDFSLVSLAARTRDPVILTALRESVVLYAEIVSFGIVEEPDHRYSWRVSPEIAERGNQFIRTFNELTESQLPVALAKNAETFALAFSKNEIIGRCVRIGDAGAGQPPYYHWAIYTTNWRAPCSLQVEDFWNSEIITTERYRSFNPHKGSIKARLT